MRAVDLIKFCAEAMKAFSKIGIKMGDCRYVKLYDEYCLMVNNGHKKEYIIAALQEKYGMSESTLRRVLKRLGSCVKN